MSFLEIVRALPHKQRVMRMYRYGLKELINWSDNRHQWYPRAAALRAEFESNRNLTSRHKIESLVEEGEELLSRFAHYEPVVRVDSAGGTDYSINPSHPKGLKVILNWDQMDPYKRGDWM